MPPQEPQSAAPTPTEPRRDQGLHAPRGALGFLESPRRFTPLRIAVQVVGFAIGVALLVWCISIALDKADAEQWRRLRDAGAQPIILLLAFTLFTVVCNGLAFWVTLLPLKRLRAADLVAVNAVATFLAYLPFKLGALARVVIHHRRDHVPFRDIVAWMAGYSALSLATLLPLVAVGALRQRFDLVSIALGILLVALANACAIALGRISRSQRWLATLSMGSWRIVQRPTPVGACALVKIGDVAVHAARFTVAASVLAIDLSLDRAVVYALAYFLLGVLSPVGMVGIREGGLVIGGAALFNLDEDAARDLSRLVLLVTASEVAAIIPLALAGAAWLRVDRLFFARRRANATPRA